MWNSVLMLALVTAADPLRLIAAFVVLSRRRPVHNLLAYFGGCLMINAVVLVIPLVVLHYTQMFGSVVQDLAVPSTAGGSAVKPFPIGMGVLSLSVALVMTARIRTPQRALVSAQPASAWPVQAGTESGRESGKVSAPRRMLGHVQDAWPKGSLWVSVLMGMSYSPVQVPIALALIATSGAAIGTQLGAAIVFIVVVLAVLEIILVSIVIAPTKTRHVLAPLHDWVQAHRRKVTAAVSAIVGVSLVVTGMGLV
jgi:hypothetical protein